MMKHSKLLERMPYVCKRKIMGFNWFLPMGPGRGGDGYWACN